MMSVTGKQGQNVMTATDPGDATGSEAGNQALRDRVRELEEALVHLSRSRDSVDLAHAAEMAALLRSQDGLVQRERRTVKYRLGDLIVGAFDPPRVGKILRLPGRLLKFWIAETKR